MKAANRPLIQPRHRPRILREIDDDNLHPVQNGLGEQVIETALRAHTLFAEHDDRRQRRRVYGRGLVCNIRGDASAVVEAVMVADRLES